MLPYGRQVIAKEYKRLDIRGGQSVGRHLHALVNLMGGLIDIRSNFLQLTRIAVSNAVISEVAGEGVTSPLYCRVAQRIQALKLPLKWLSALAWIALAVASSTRSPIIT